MMIRPAPRASLPEIPDGTRPKDQCHDGFFNQDDNDKAERLFQSGRHASFRETAETGSAQAKAALRRRALPRLMPQL